MLLETPTAVAAAARRGMTLVELLLVYALLGLGLTLMAGLCDYVQRQAKERLAEDMVLTLRDALLAYRSTARHFPPGREDQAPDEAMAAMLQVDASAEVLREWPVSPGADNRPAPLGYLDPWGRPFRYITAHNGNSDQRERVAGDGGVPIFESAGPDGDFGDRDPRGGDDNLASDFIMITRSGE